MAPLNPKLRVRPDGKVEMTWTPDPRCFGYRFYRDGQPVAKGANAFQKVTTFAAANDNTEFGIARAIEQPVETVRLMKPTAVSKPGSFTTKAH